MNELIKQEYFVIKLGNENTWVSHFDIVNKAWGWTHDRNCAKRFYDIRYAKEALNFVQSQQIFRGWYISTNYEPVNKQLNDINNELLKEVKDLQERNAILQHQLEEAYNENAELKEECDKLKHQNYALCCNITKFENENIELRKEVKDYKERTAAMQHQLDEAAADRWEAQFKLAIKDASLMTLADSFYELQAQRSLTSINNVIFNDPATIVFWKDGTKTVVKNHEKRKKFDPEKGLAMAICKKLGGNKRSYYNIFKKWLPKK